MAQPYIGEIRLFAGNFAPAGWAFCDGQLLPISENDALFTLIGTTYGGNGQETFALPNLQSRVPVHMGTGPDGTTYVIGEMAGVEEVTLTVQQIPVHNHAPAAYTGGGTLASPAGGVWSASGLTQFADLDQRVPMGSTYPTGGSQPHTNLQPYLAIHYIISLFGLFPQQT